MLHLYWGDGKGKTTAAMGLALRALGHGRRVVILQFLKDGSSGEIEMLRRCGAAVYACPNAKFTWLMTDAERAEARRTNTRTLQTILQGSFDLLVLDEACAACKNDLVEEALLREAAARAEQGAEVVLTGREPAAWMQDARSGCWMPPTTPPSCAPSSTPTPGASPRARALNTDTYKGPRRSLTMRAAGLSRPKENYRSKQKMTFLSGLLFVIPPVQLPRR